MTSVILSNFTTLAVVIIAVWLLRKASRRSHWQSAWRQLKTSRLAMISLGIVCIYVAIALLDSIVWRDRASGPDGAPAVDRSGHAVYEPRIRSLLDRICAPIAGAGEKTYSAPLASRLYVKEPVTKPDGTSARERPKLKHPGRHLFGTDKVGNDVLYLALKGVHTALVIGALATVIVIPLSIMFGVTAGYFGGRIDDIVQYLYTTLASIPSILLIISFMMFSDVMFGGLPRIIPISIILGITTWTGLCRLLRGETLKLRELEYVQAARALGVGHIRVITSHILPNIMHIVVISSVLRFSVLVLTEAVLSYLNIGVEPGTGSWGHMINAARQELAREPIVWWNLTAAFVFMVGLVLPVNLFGDALRDSLDPKLRT